VGSTDVHQGKAKRVHARHALVGSVQQSRNRQMGACRSFQTRVISRCGSGRGASGSVEKSREETAQNGAAAYWQQVGGHGGGCLWPCAGPSSREEAARSCTPLPGHTPGLAVEYRTRRNACSRTRRPLRAATEFSRTRDACVRHPLYKVPRWMDGLIAEGPRRMPARSCTYRAALHLGGPDTML
jgi:hypothetical protein